MLGVWKAGAAYVPLDPSHPAERLSYVLSDCTPSAILADDLPSSWISTGDVPVIDMTVMERSALPATNPAPPRATSGDLAYIIYTSGSTGRPKGVMIEHRGLVNFLLAAAEAFEVTSDDLMLAVTTLSFDIAAMEIFLPLVRGARVVVATRDEAGDAHRLQALMLTTRATLMQATPATWRMLVESGWSGEPTLKAFCGGEALTPSLASRLVDRVGTLWNLYGPTETTIYSTLHEVKRPDTARPAIPIGRPLANTQIYILAADGKPTPMGVPGEIHIGGVGVARGYLNRDELTAERFVDASLHAGSAARLYKTGDLGSWRPDGRIEYLGRNDFQIKIRGFRIELGEIEAHLLAHPSVREAVVVAHDTPAGGKQLVAYLVARENEVPNADELRSNLERRLPAYMVPSVYLTLPAFPLTGSGKLDRQALPKPHAGIRNEIHEAPQGDIESALAAIWTDVLRVERVGRHDDFFALGGDSIVAMQVVARARGKNMALSVRDLLECQTIARLAERNVSGGAPKVSQEPVEGLLPLLPVHRDHFVAPPDHLNQFNMSVLTHVPPALGMDELVAIVVALHRRHDALRARFEYDDGEWSARHVPFHEGFGSETCIEEHLEVHPGGFPQALLERCDVWQRSLDLRNGPLFRAILFHGSDGERRLWLLAHHAIFDGVSWRILLADVEAAFGALAAHRPLVLAPKTHSLQDWGRFLGEYAKTDAVYLERDFWLAQLVDGGLRAPPGVARCTAASMAWADIHVSAEDTATLLRDAAGETGTRASERLAAAVVLGLMRWSGESRILMRMEHHGRQGQLGGMDLSETVGFFTSSYPLLFDAGNAEENLAGWVALCRQYMRSAPHDGLGYGVLRHIDGDAMLASRSARMLDAVAFNYLGRFDTAGSAYGQFPLADEATGHALDPRRLLPYLLGVQGGVWQGVMRLRIDYSSSQYAPTQIQELSSHISEAIRDIARSTDTKKHDSVLAV
jgi:amino acid adenylation domain-containing protein/non-ribosomal peptide synthase protein (TIGR01720 family)